MPQAAPVRRCGGGPGAACRSVVAEMRAIDPKIVPQVDLMQPYMQLGAVDVVYQLLFEALGPGPDGRG